MDNKIIVVISGGVLQDVYSTNPNTTISLLDYDNMKYADENSEEYREYALLDSEIQTNKLNHVW